MSKWKRLFWEAFKRHPIADTNPPTTVLSPGMYVPSGKDPYRWPLDADECVLSAETGRCLRAHEPGPDGHVWFDLDATGRAPGPLSAGSSSSSLSA